MSGLVAVIPAAGLGTRLGRTEPKVLVPICEGERVLDRLLDVLGPIAEVVLVLSPSGLRAFGEIESRGKYAAVQLATQLRPTGMGDAIFGAQDLWGHADALVVVWGDQVNLSSSSVRGAIDRHSELVGSGVAGVVTVPLVSLPEPYVEYVVVEGVLVDVLMSREGDSCRSGGLSDVGLFCLTADGLSDAWSDYARSSTPGRLTGELNFLPFLSYLCRDLGWVFASTAVNDPAEARGINTPEDLEFARSISKRRGS